MRRPIVALVACPLLMATGLGLLGVAAPTLDADAPPATEPLAADVTLLVPHGPVIHRFTRLALPPRAVLTPVLASVPTALVVEAGAVGVRTYTAQVGVNMQEDAADTVLRRGDHLVVDPGTVRTVRNVGPAPAEVLVVAIEQFAAASPSPSVVAWETGPKGS
jgi:hypothetical protein